MFSLKKVLFVSFLTLSAITCFADDTPIDSIDTTQAQTITSHRNFLHIAAINNNPTSTTSDKVSTGRGTYLIGYRHLASNNWFMGLSFGFKELQKRVNGTAFSFFTITHESNYLYRLYRPFYLLLGGKVLYLYPTKSTEYPIQRDKNFRAEIGVAAALGLTYHLGEQTFLTFETNRWRGVETDFIHGTEVCASISFAIW